jgi:glutamate synthase (NADPH) small chain
VAKNKMAKNVTNYKTIKRQTIKYRSIEERTKDYKDILADYAESQIRDQASRCQNCGIPFCHGFGCPVSNFIPDWNELVYQGKWREALDLLHATNNFPEITGRVCPALCEEACTLNVGMEPVTIKNIELAITERGFKEGWIKAVKPRLRTGKHVAVIGSGPAGLAAAQNLNRMGHNVTLFEKDQKAGGFLRYGIPDFKLEKSVIDRRLDQMEEEGVIIKTDCYAGTDLSVNYLLKNFDAIVLAVGSRDPRDIQIDGRNLKGIYLATDYLKQSNERVQGMTIPQDEIIDARGKNVVVIGGGDTGADCIGTARRQNAKNIWQWEIMPKPSEERPEDTPWPMYSKKLRTNSSQEEGCERKWCIMTKKFTGNGKVEKISACEVEWKPDANGRWQMSEKPGTEFVQDADLVLLAMGFTHPVFDSLLKDLRIDLDKAGNIKTDKFGFGVTSNPKVFAAGDASRGASLVVWAITHGREVADMVDGYLKK